MNKFNVSITDNQDIFSIDPDKIRQIVDKMLQYIINDGEIIASSALGNIAINDKIIAVDIMFCGDEQIKELNNNYRGKNRPTDVLSFALFADNPDDNFIIDNIISMGEIIISVETAKKQSEERNKTFHEEIYFLLSHGLLHLLGFDHPDDESLKDMLALQEEMTDFALYRFK